MPISIWRHFHFPAAHLSNLTSSAERCHKRDATSRSDCSLRCHVRKNVMIVVSINSDFYEQRIRNYVLTVWENAASWHIRQNNFQTPPLSRTSPLGTQKSARLAWGHIILIFLCLSISYLLLFPRTNPAILNRSCTTPERFLLASVLQSLTKMLSISADSAQTEYCSTFPCLCVSHRRDISSFLHNLIV